MPVLPIQIDKTKPPLFSGYRKLLAFGLALVVIALLGIFHPDSVNSAGQWIVTLAGAYFGSNAASSIARSIKEAKAATRTESSGGLPGPDELDGDLPLTVHDGELAAGHPEE